MSHHSVSTWSVCIFLERNAASQLHFVSVWWLKSVWRVCVGFVSQPTSAGAPEKDLRSDTRMYRSWRSNPNTRTAKRRWYCEWDFYSLYSLFINYILYFLLCVLFPSFLPVLPCPTHIYTTVTALWRSSEIPSKYLAAVQPLSKHPVACA